jgi:hypothetical protein
LPRGFKESRKTGWQKKKAGHSTSMIQGRDSNKRTSKRAGACVNQSIDQFGGLDKRRNELRVAVAKKRRGVLYGVINPHPANRVDVAFVLLDLLGSWADPVAAESESNYRSRT